MPFAPASGFPMGTSVGCGPGCTAVCGSCRHFGGSPTEWPRPTAPNRGWGLCPPRKRGGCGGGRVQRVLANVALGAPPWLRKGAPAARACRGSLRAPAAQRPAAWCTNKDLRHVRTWQVGGITQRKVGARWHTVGTKLARSWRAPTQDLARANSSVGARQVMSWRAPSRELARQLLIWRAPTPLLARAKSEVGAPTYYLARAKACSFPRPLAALTPLALFRPPGLGVQQVGNRMLVQQALQLREGGLFDPHVDGHMALGAECRVQLNCRGLQIQHMVGVGATLCPPPPQLHAPAPWRTGAAATLPSAFPSPSPAAPTRRARQ